MRFSSSIVSSVWRAVALAAAAVTLASAPAQAGRGSSPGAIRNAISSNSAEAIAAELERAEVLMCPSCVGMVKPLIDHADVRVRQVAAWWLARRMRSELFVEMATRLAQPDSRLARNAADALGELKMKRALVPLGAGLGNPVFDGEARAAMARAIGAIGDPQGLPLLNKALGESDAGVRAAALAAMRAVRGFSDPAAAAALLEDGDEAVRIQATYTIGFARGSALAGREPEIRDRIVRALAGRVTGDASVAVRKKAAWALGEIGAPAAVAAPALQQAATRDDSAVVRSLAAAALGRLSP